MIYVDSGLNSLRARHREPQQPRFKHRESLNHNQTYRTQNIGSIPRVKSRERPCAVFQLLNRTYRTPENLFITNQFRTYILRGTECDFSGEESENT